MAGGQAAVGRSVMYTHGQSCRVHVGCECWALDANQPFLSSILDVEAQGRVS